MNQRYFLYLTAIALFLFISFMAFSSWKFLLESVERAREVQVGILELPDVDMERYNKIVKKGI